MRTLHVLERARSVVGSGFVLLLGVVGLLASGASADEQPARCQSKPLIVKIHADWCGSCRATQQTWDKIVAELAEEVTAIKFDVSDRIAHRASAEEAKRLGISEFFQEYDRRTGAIVVLDCNTFEPLVVFGGERDFEKYRDAIRKAAAPSQNSRVHDAGYGLDWIVVDRRRSS